MRVNFYASVKYGNKVFSSGYDWLTGLFSINIEDGEVKFLKLFEKEVKTPLIYDYVKLNNPDGFEPLVRRK